MKKIALAVLVLSSLFFLSSCKRATLTTPPSSEVDDYLKQFPNTPNFDKQCLHDGAFRMGMLNTTVQFMMGQEPQKKSIIKQKWADQEIWTYQKGGKRIFTFEDGTAVGIDIQD